AADGIRDRNVTGVQTCALPISLVNPVDDAAMGITHVLRGEDLLSSTPRQVALYRALIVVGAAEHIPQFAHLPYVMGDGKKKLSRAEEHTSELQSRFDLVCRLLL